MTPTFAHLCQDITFTAERTILTRGREALRKGCARTPGRERAYHIMMRYQGRVLRQTVSVYGGNVRPTCAEVLGRWLDMVEAVNPDHGVDYGWWLNDQGLEANRASSRIYHANLAFLKRLKTFLGEAYPTFAAARPA